MEDGGSKLGSAHEGLVDRAGRYRFLILLVALATLMLAYPLAKGKGTAPRMIFQACFQLVMLAGPFAMHLSRRWLAVGLALAIPSFSFFWLSVLSPDARAAQSLALESTNNLALAVFLLQVVVFTLIDLFSSQRVTVDKLCGSLNVFLLLRLAFGFLYTSLELHAPGTFAFSDPHQALASTTSNVGPLDRSSALFYYSFVTLTSLGYGDITPRAPVAQMLSIWETVLGQAYLTILVARLVGLHVASSRIEQEP